MLEANDPKLKTWVPVDEDSDFPIQNLPFGIFESPKHSPRAGIAIGKMIVDLNELQQMGYFDSLNLPDRIFDNEVLNPFMKLGKSATRKVRNRVSELLREGNEELAGNDIEKEKALVGQMEVTMRMPIRVGDYTDFYSSEQHATNVGTMFRDPDNALLPNWKYIPVGYHGRSSTIVLSGTDIHRPKGQQKPNPEEPPVFGPCKLLDFELEMGFVTYEGKPMGQSISTEEAPDYIFGMFLFNDWSARDIQKWEYVPLGPFLAKSFASSVSPWIVTLDALEPFRVAGPKQEPEVFPYLQFKGDKNFDIDLEVFIQPPNADEHRVCHSNYKYMYWNQEQQLAHHTVNGCYIREGDVMASGTISGPEPESFGSMLELAWKGTKPLQMPDGSERKFILDGDTVVMRGHAHKDGVRIGFGEVRNKVLPAI